MYCTRKCVLFTWVSCSVYVGVRIVKLRFQFFKILADARKRTRPVSATVRRGFPRTPSRFYKNREINFYEAKILILCKERLEQQFWGALAPGITTLCALDFSPLWLSLAICPLALALVLALVPLAAVAPLATS